MDAVIEKQAEWEYDIIGKGLLLLNFIISKETNKAYFSGYTHIHLHMEPGVMWLL